MNVREYTSRRTSIVTALVEAIKSSLTGEGQFSSNVGENVHPKMLFWDEINEFPAVHIAAGRETREYQGGGYKDRILQITIRCYVKDEDDSLVALETLLEDIETVIELNGRLAYQDPSGAINTTRDITILAIDTDEGLLDPLGVGDIQLQVRY